MDRTDGTATEDGDERGRSGLSRRRFLQGSGAAVAVAGFGLVTKGCTTETTAPPEAPTSGPDVLPEDGIIPAQQGDALRFFNPEQGRTVDSIVARLIPGDPGDPGAREAGVVFYIDQLLATHSGYAEKTYTDGPLAQPYTGDAEPEPENGIVWVPEEEFARYGWQLTLPPREIYQMGLARIDALAQQRFDSAFVDLSEDDQDAILEAIEDDEDDDVAEVFGDLPAGQFFAMLRDHTFQGFLGDPVYGGNRDMVGWRLIGFPGERRAYSPEDMHNERFAEEVEPQSLFDLPTFHAHHEGDDDALITVRKRHPNGPID